MTTLPLGYRAVPHRPPSMLQGKPTADPGALVARALGILAEEHMRGGEVRPSDLPLQRGVRVVIVVAQRLLDHDQKEIIKFF